MARVYVDVREPFEFAMGHVKGAVNIPTSSLLKGSKKLEAIPKDAELIVYCRTGHRSAVAIDILRKLGYNDLTNGINKAKIEATYQQ